MHKNYLQYSYLTYSSLKVMHIDTFSTPFEVYYKNG